MKIYEFKQRDIVTAKNQLQSSIYVSEADAQPNMSRRGFLGGLGKAAAAGAAVGMGLAGKDAAASWPGDEAQDRAANKAWERMQKDFQEAPKQSMLVHQWMGRDGGDSYHGQYLYNARIRDLGRGPIVGIRHGYGIKYFSPKSRIGTDSVYIGNFRNDQPDGTGEYWQRGRNGKFDLIYTATFKNGQVIPSSIQWNSSNASNKVPTNLSLEPSLAHDRNSIEQMDADYFGLPDRILSQKSPQNEIIKRLTIKQ